MGFRGLLITPQDKNNQPVHSNCAAITFDGRLDQRTALATEIAGSQHTMASDAELVLAAYERNGAKCFSELSGEFAFVLWDAREQSLYLVRSLCGTRPLVYTSREDQLMWSSELDDLVLKSGVDPVVNDGYIGRYLYFHPETDETPFAHISIVPPGSYIEVRHPGRVIGPIRTWFAENICALQLPSDSDYEEAWRSAVELAIADRLRSSRGVFSELSGGLDSSTMVFMADRVLESTKRDSSFLTTVSSTFEVSEDSDESLFIDLAEKARGRVGIHITESSQQITLGLSNITFSGIPTTKHLFPGYFRQVSELMRASGSRVLLNGVGGDELFWSEASGSPELADLLVEGHFRIAFSRARQWSQLSGTPAWKLLLTWAVAPINRSGRLFTWISKTENRLGYLLTAYQRKRLAEGGRSLGLRVEPDVNPPSRRSRLFSIRTAIASFASGVFHNVNGIYYSHPFSHQQLINFMLSLPIDQVSRPGQNRSIMRRAMRGILPEKICLRKSKSGPDEAFCRAVIREQETIGSIPRMMVCEREYIDSTKLSEAIHLATLGRVEEIGSLLNVFSAERWLRSVSMIEQSRAQLQLSFQDAVLSGLTIRPAGSVANTTSASSFLPSARANNQ